MIITVTLNLALDRTLAVPRIRLGHRHRAVESTRAPGGKGVNVARVLKALGEPVIATGFAGGPTGARVRDLLSAEQVLHDFVETEGDSRTNISLVDPTSGEQTEVNERGPSVTAEEIGRFRDRLAYLARGARLCVIAGSLPPGAPFELYAELIGSLRQAGVPVLLDSDGEPMRAGMRAQPQVVAPNVAEAEEAVGFEFTEHGDLSMGLKGLLELGASEAIITTRDGCVAALEEGGGRRQLEATIGHLEPIASVGAGDAFLAGFAACRLAGRPAADSLAFSVACGADSTQRLGAGTLDPGEVDRLLGRVSVKELEVPLEVG